MRAASTTTRCLRFSCAFAVTAIGLHAQCTTAWSPAAGALGLVAPQATASDMVSWDPDGAGPATPVLVVAGIFGGAGAIGATHLAAWDPSTRRWLDLGSGADGPVYGLAVLPNGDLVASGTFTMIDGVAANSIARYDGSTWWPLAGGIATPGLQTYVTTLVVMPNGDLIAGGIFQNAAGFGATGVARWDGVSWSALGLGINGAVNDLTVDATGDLVVVGSFTSAGGSPALNVARWDGATWSPMGSGVQGNVRTVVTRANGNVVVAGSLLNGSTPGDHVRVWSGASWTPLGSVGTPAFFNQTVWALLDVPGLGLLAGGTFQDPGPSGVTNFGRWDGLAWQPVATTPQGITVLRLIGAGIVAAGGFTDFGNVAVLNGDWEPLGTGFDNFLSDLHAAPDGSLLAAGGFSWVGGARAERVARLSNGAWSALGTGVTGSARAICALANGDVVVGGQLTAAGGVPVNNIARWDGSAWSPMGLGIVNGFVLDLAALPDGSVVVAGGFSFPSSCIARWHAGSWSTLGTGVDAAVSALLVMPNGDVVAAGQFTTAGGVAAARIARWNGSSWSAIGAGFPGVNDTLAALALLPNGDLVVGGYLPVFGHVARWNGTAWSALGAGTGVVRELQVLPNGDLAAVGTWGGNSGFAARWDGATWLALAPGMNAEASALAMTADGRLAVGGSFRASSTNLAHHLAYVDATCLATAVPFGVACPGSGGANHLVATTLPWLGATFTARGTGLANPSLVVAVFGLATASVPLVTLLPQAGAGCNLWVAPDVLLAQVSTNGTATTSIALPVNSALVGAVLHQQLVPFEISANGTVTSTNGLAATIGAF